MRRAISGAALAVVLVAWVGAALAQSAPRPAVQEARASSPQSGAQPPAAPIEIGAKAPRAPDLPPGVSRALYQGLLPKGAPDEELVALGEALFNDKRLSLDDTVSCATCHDPAKGFVDGLPVSEGVQKKKGTRNSPTVLNAMFGATQFWDGRSPTLEEQAKLPILNPVEMAMPDGAAVERKVRGIAEYTPRFQKLFGRQATFDDIATAIAAFEKTQFSGNAPFDRFILGDAKAINAQARRGWTLFNGKARCNACHAGNIVSPLFSDQKFHNIGVAAQKQDFPQLAADALRIVRTGDEKQIDELALQTKFSELGRFLVTKNENDIGAFKTPTLKNVGITGPYMHDGSMTTLWDVMDHYNKGGIANPFLDGGMQRLGLTEREIDDLVELMFAFTDDRYAAFQKQERARQSRLKGKRPQRDTAVALGKKGSVGDLAPNPDLEQKNPADIGVFGVVR